MDKELYEILSKILQKIYMLELTESADDTKESLETWELKERLSKYFMEGEQ